MPQQPKPSGKPKKEKGFKLRADAETAESEAPAELNPAAESFEDLGELPHGYGEDVIFLIAQEPHWLFTYWDIDIAKHPGGAALLRYYGPGGEIEGEIEVPFETRNWYVPVKQAAAEYYVEIGFYRGKTWNLIARSVTVTTPAEGLAASEDFEFATIPFHLSFQRLIDNLESAVRSGEGLASAVSRMQQNGDFSAFGGMNFPDLLSEEQRALLRSLLGSDLAADLSSGALSSTEMEAKLQAFFAEHLSSGAGASEFLSSFRQTAALFSGSGLSSETVAASWGGAMLASWAASLGGGSWTESSSFTAGMKSALTSWAQSHLSSWTQANLSSFEQAALASWGQAVLTSWGQAALSSWGQTALTSWTSGGESSASLAAMSSWLQGVQSSWLQGIQSSWAQAALTSWTSAEVTSWFSAESTTSWGGASETLSSFGAGGERSFFMHVNAEVIFYGGTDPRAKVTIDGQPITLNPDGTFRYHFLFPNADYEIPIVAESPDGVETRSASLKFHRSTGKVGIVTDTPQPPLGTPMGKVES